MLDEVVGEEEGEGPEDFEDQANQGKQPFDHDTTLVHRYPFFYRLLMMKYDGGKLVVNHHVMHTLPMTLPCS